MLLQLLLDPLVEEDILETMQRDAEISFPGLGIFGLNPPASFTIFGRTIYFYGVLIALGFLFGILYCARRSKDFGIKSDNVYDLVLLLIPLSILCARIYYVLFRLDEFAGKPFLSYLAVWEGGIAIYGQIIGRWGNFMNREAFGGATDIFCRMRLTDPSGRFIEVHPTFLYESLWNLVLLIGLEIWQKKGKRKYDGQLALLYFFGYGLGRAWIEGLRTDSLYIGHTGIRVSQALSLALVLFSLIVLLLQRRREHPAEKLYVNRVKDAEKEEKPAEDTKKEEA